ncbi:MAG TPA: hypothetical protein VK498_13885 [Ferruginibacter sp.]|nr:hypothetical protein [Ferruginibacter sp.]
MELDDLKKNWKETKIETNKTTDIMQLIQHKSYGPVAELKKGFRKQMIAMSIIPFLLLLTNIDDVNKVLTSILFWSYIIFCIVIVMFAKRNYQIAGKMEGMDGMVKSNLEQQIAILEKRLQWKIVGLRIVLLFFIALVEIVPYFQHYRMLDKWHSLSPVIRFASYAALLVLQYILSTKLMFRRFGSHLQYLKELVKEM